MTRAIEPVILSTSPDSSLHLKPEVLPVFTETPSLQGKPMTRVPLLASI